MVDEQEVISAADEVDDADQLEYVPRRPWWARALKGMAIAVAVLVVIGVLLYNFGGMMPPSAEAKDQYAKLQALGAVPPPQERFHIPIPGCVCHSDNPVLQVEHSSRSMKECASCHGAAGVAAQQ